MRRLAATLTLAALALAPNAAPANGPARTATVSPGALRTFANVCPPRGVLAGRASEVDARAVRGPRLGTQHRHSGVLSWHGRRGAVTYDTPTGGVRNGTRVAVVIRLYCS